MKRTLLTAVAVVAAALIALALVLPMPAQGPKAPAPVTGRPPLPAPPPEEQATVPSGPTRVLEAARAAGLKGSETNALEEYMTGRQELKRSLVQAWGALREAAEDASVRDGDLAKQLEAYQAQVAQLREAESSLADALRLADRPRLAAALTVAGLLDNGLCDLALDRGPQRRAGLPRQGAQAAPAGRGAAGAPTAMPQPGRKGP